VLQCSDGCNDFEVADGRHIGTDNVTVEHEDERFLDRILEGIEYVGLALEVLAVSVIIVGVVYATGRALLRRHKHSGVAGDPVSNRAYRRDLGNTLILGLEILVAADIVRTVALEPTLENVLILGLLVLIRTFLSWSLTVELEGRWPWKGARVTASSGE